MNKIYEHFLTHQFPARSQTEARKSGLQHHMGLNARNPDFVACEQQKAHSRSLINTFVVQSH